MAPDAGVLAPLQGVLPPGGLSAPPAVAAAIALDNAALRLNSMLLLLGMLIARPCSRSATTVMLSVDSRRCARSTRSLASVSAFLLRARERRAAATACTGGNCVRRSKAWRRKVRATDGTNRAADRTHVSAPRL